MSGAPTVTVVCADPADQPPRLAEQVDAELRSVHDIASLRAALPVSDAVFVWDFAGSALRESWSADTQVSWIHVASAGVEPLLFPELRAAPVTLTNSRGVFDVAIAEFVLGAMLAFAKDLPTSLRLQAAHRWQHRETLRLAGSRVLVIGAGSIGRAVARLAHACGCAVTGVARAARNDPDFEEVVGFGELPTVLPAADYLVVAAPLTEQTRGMLGESAFARVRPGAVLVNVGRGPIVDERALLRALDDGRLRGAALDVFGAEPLPADHPFWDRPDVLVSAHMAGDFVGFRDVLVDLFVANYRRWRAGQPLQNVVEKSRGY